MIRGESLISSLRKVPLPGSERERGYKINNAQCAYSSLLERVFFVLSQHTRIEPETEPDPTLKPRPARITSAGLCFGRLTNQQKSMQPPAALNQTLKNYSFR